MRKTLAALVAVALLTIPLSVQASEECPNPDRPMHYSPFCLTQAEYLALTSPPVPTSMKHVTGVEQWRPMVAYYWGKHGATDRMLRIMRCESLGDPNARNRSSGAAGLFQVMPGWQRTWPGDYFDPWTNAAVAYQIWLAQGFSAWVCRG